MKTQFFRVALAALAISGIIPRPGCAETNLEATPPAVPVPEGTNSPAATPAQAPVAKLVRPPAAPAEIHPSPALAEVIKLAQAGVGEDVMLAYIGNATRPFSVSSDQIVYLNDLGVSSAVITSLMQHDSSLGTTGKQSAPQLPSGVGLTSPATNIFPPAYAPPVAPPPATAYNPANPIPYDTTPALETEPPPAPDYFYGSLSPYGAWIDVGGYGRCWQPTVAVISPSWQPYCDRGHWLWTDAGWYWYSDYSWGWAPFHYGRWCSAPRLEWFWVPDTCWGPAWVSWRHTPAYCGWAPLPPAAHFVSGVGFVHGGVSVGVGFDFGLSASLYTFVPLAHFSDRSFHNYRVPASQTTVIYRNSSVINNYVVHNNTVINNGVGVATVARATGHPISTVTVRTGDVGTGNNAARHEHLQNNGTSLAVVRPPLPDPGSRPHLSSANRAGFGAASQPGYNAAVTPKTPNTGFPAPKMDSVHTAKAAGSWPSSAQPLTVAPDRRTEPPAPSSQNSSPVQAMPGNRLASSNPQFGSQSQWYRVYPNTPAPTPPAAPRSESIAPQFNRNVPNAPNVPPATVQSQSQWHRVYPSAPAPTASASPRAQSFAPQFSRSVPNTPPPPVQTRPAVSAPAHSAPAANSQANGKKN